MKSQRLSDVLLFVLVLAMFLSSCQSSRYYTEELPVLRVKTPSNWQVIDSLIVLNRHCDRFDRGRRFVWLMIWETLGDGAYSIELTEDRLIPDGAFGCVFLEGEPVVLIGEREADMFLITDAKVELKLDDYEGMNPETYSVWMLNYVDSNFDITASYPLPCWRIRDSPSDP